MLLRKPESRGTNGVGSEEHEGLREEGEVEVKSRRAGHQEAQAESLLPDEANQLPMMQQQHGRIPLTSRWAKGARHKRAHTNSIYIQFKAKLIYGDRNDMSGESGWGGDGARLAIRDANS